MEIGEKIRAIRIENGLSQEQFADIFHVTRQAVSNWENGRNYPDMDTLRSISDRFGVPVDEFIRGDESPGMGSDEASVNDTGKLRKKDRNKKLMILLGSLALTVLMICIAVPGIVKSIYYDPDEILYSRDFVEDGEQCSESIKRMTSDLTVYSDMFLPGLAVNYISGNYRSLGCYDISIQITDFSKDDGDSFIGGKIERGHLQIYDPDIFERDSFLWNTGSDRDLNRSLEDNLREEYKNRLDREEFYDYIDSFPELEDDRLYQVYVSFNEIRSFPETVDWVGQFGDEIYDPWVAVVLEEIIGVDPAGFYIWSDKNSFLFDKEEYPYLAGYEDQDIDFDEPLTDEKNAQTHMISTLKYLKDQKKFRRMMNEAGVLWPELPDDRYIDEYISYIEKNGLQIYGVALIADKEELQMIFNDPAVHSMEVQSE